jgi:hypothetical protein
LSLGVGVVAEFFSEVGFYWFGGVVVVAIKWMPDICKDVIALSTVGTWMSEWADFFLGGLRLCLLLFFWLSVGLMF